MEEHAVELIDYLRTIYKRKILIIVGTLACILGGGVISLTLPVTYSSDAVIKIGKRVELGVPFPALSSFTSALIPFDNPADIAKYIPIKFGQNIKRVSGFNLKTEVLEGTSMIRIILKGPDRRTEKFLKEIINKLIDEHHRMAEASISQFENLTDKLGAEIEAIQDSIAVSEEKLQEAKSMEKEIHADMTVTMKDLLDSKSIDIGRALIERAYNKVLSIEGILRDGRIRLGDRQRQLLMYQTFLRSLEGYDTKLIGEMENSAIKPKRKHSIIIAGVVGLTMSLFLAFFVEYLGNVREREEEKNSV